MTTLHLSSDDIMQFLQHKHLTVETYPEVSSTNTLLKHRGQNGAPHGLILAAEKQTAGRGRMGRTFYSPDQTGVYFSILLRPNFSPADALLITTCAAVACARVLEKVSRKKAEIKWVNDIYIDGRKVCGILTEASISQGTIDFAVLGIGINLYTPDNGFPSELRHKAGSVFSQQTADLRAYIIAEVVNAFFAMYETIENRAFIEEYQRRSMLDNQPITVIKTDCMLPATALCVDSDLSLVVRYEDGTIEHLTSGDVSIEKL